MSAPAPARSAAGLGRLDLWRVGVVVDFDEARGLGTLEADDGELVPFHCVAIADGSRSVPVGARVRYRLAMGPTGVLEARALTPA